MLPPEVNSGRMYSGAGPGPMLAAAASWDALAAELHTVGAAYDTVITELDRGWSGPSAAAMATAATPYAKWMHVTSATAEQAAGQARAAAAAYEAAFAMTVPPPAVAANRMQLLALLATNFLGQNTPAIAATEAHYAEMWAQDATAMYGYAHSAAAASALTPFTEPPQTTNPAGPAAQAGAIGRTAASVGGHADTLASGVMHAVSGMTSPSAATPSADAGATLAALAPAALVEPAIVLSLAGSELVTDLAGTFGIDVLGTFLIDGLGAGIIWEELLPLAGLAGSVSPVAATLGEATLVSGLSVPQAWALAVSSATQQIGAALPAAAASEIRAAEMAIPFAGIAGAGLAGRATAAVGTGGGSRVTATTRRRLVSQPRQHTERPLPVYGLINGVDVELRELAELREASVLTDEEYARQKRRLLGR